jgi:hypothetical protein
VRVDALPYAGLCRQPRASVSPAHGLTLDLHQ